MFAGEGGPERTNRRFHYVSAEMPAKRLSTAFDSVTFTDKILLYHRIFMVKSEMREFLLRLWMMLKNYIQVLIW
jgi:hypothetical protein